MVVVFTVVVLEAGRVEEVEMPVVVVLRKGSVTTLRPESPHPTNRKRRSGLTIRDRTGYETETWSFFTYLSIGSYRNIKYPFSVP